MSNLILKPHLCTTLTELLDQRVAHQPDQHGYSFLADGKDETERLTYHELSDKAKSLATYLLNQGNAAGDRALLLYPPGLDFLIGFFGCMYAGIIAIPSPPPDPARLKRSLPRLRSIVVDANATMVLTSSRLRDQLDEAVHLETFRDMTWIATDKILSVATAYPSIEISISSDALAYLQYTSGSTSAPKGVMISHHNILHHSAYIQKYWGYTPESVAVTWMPYFHDYGLVDGLLQPLYSGIPCYIMSPLAFLKRPHRWLEAITRYKGTHTQGPNFAYDHCIESVSPEQREKLDLSSLRTASNGAEPVRRETVEQFIEVFSPCGFHPEAFYPAYGLAEFTLLASTKPHGESPRILSLSALELENNRVAEVTSSPDNQHLVRDAISCGPVLGKTRVVIVDPQTMLPSLPNEVGEIWLSDESVALGYWNNPEATQQTFHAYLADTGAGPFLRTGDLGFLYQGELYIAGRLKDVIIIRGSNHYPQDIEITVEKSHPYLRANCGAAFCVELDGEEQLVVVQEVKKTALKSLNVDEIVRVIREAVALEHGIETHNIVLLKPGSIAKTSSGKIQRQKCRAQFLDQSLECLNFELSSSRSTYIPPRNNIEGEILSIWEDILGIQDVGVQDNFFELGGNSLKAAKLVSRMESKYSRQLSLSQIAAAPTIAQQAILLERDQQISQSSMWTPLVPLQTKGDLFPFFAVHAQLGDAYIYKNLSRELGDNQPFYGLQAKWLGPNQVPDRTVEEIAASYISAIRIVQPHGPYLIGGYSAGGIIAYEMAQQLMSQGEDIELLVELDTALDTLELQLEGSRFSRMGKRLNIFFSIFSEFERTQVRQSKDTFMSRIVNFLPRLYWFFRNAVIPNRIARSLLIEAGKKYRLCPYSGKITLIRVQGCDARYTKSNTDDYLWHQYTERGVDVRYVSGQHFSILEYPHVTEVAHHLKEILEAANNSLNNSINDKQDSSDQ